MKQTKSEYIVYRLLIIYLALHVLLIIILHYLQFRAANRLGRARLLIIEFSKDVYSLWRYGAPFPTFLKIIGTLLLCLVATLPLLYPFFVVAFTYFIYEGLFLRYFIFSAHFQSGQN